MNPVVSPVQVGRATWPEKFGSGGAAHGIVLDMLSDLRKDMEDWMHRRKLSKHVVVLNFAFPNPEAFDVILHLSY